MNSEKQQTILLVEDNFVIATAETRSLEQFGYKVINAYSGEKAVQLALVDKNINLILMDINLGRGIDGTEAVRQILTKRTIPIVFLTAHNEEEYVERVKRITRYGYVLKSAGDFVLKSSIEMAFELFESHEKIKTSEVKYRRLHETMMDAFVLVDMAGNILEVNQSFMNMTGYSMEELLRLTYHELTPEKWRFIETNIVDKQIMVQGFSDVYEKEYIRKDGSIFPVELRTFLINDDEGTPIKLWAIVRDTTERKQAEEALCKSEYDLAEAQRLAKIGSWRFDVSTNSVRWSDELYRVFDVDRMEFSSLYASFLRHVHPEDRIKVLEINKKTIERGEPFNLTYRILTKTNQVKHIREVGYTMKDDHGNVTGLFGTAQDITERKQAEEALQEEERRLRVALKPINMAVFNQDLELRYTWMYQPQIGYTTEQVIGKTDAELLPPGAAHKIIEIKLRVLENRIGTREVVEVESEDRTLYYDLVVEPLRNLEGQIIGITGASLDITERKLAEDVLLSSLNEKEILLRELHHRTKNNMQVISGVLDLQASSSGNQELIEMLNESQRRIRAMALVHEKLLGSKDFASIDLAGYVRTLSQELFQSHNIPPARIDLIIEADSGVFVDINKATPCGLILNELISNALKHAFPGDSPGVLRIVIGETKDAEIEIVIHDNGLGLPDDIDIHKPHSVGLQLVNGLVIKQLDGQIDVRRDAGTEFRIKFPLLFVENREAIQ